MNVLQMEVTLLIMSLVIPLILLPVCFIILIIIKVRERRDHMAITKRLYNKDNNCIGRVKFNKKNSTVDVIFNDNLKYVDINLSFDEFDEYKRRFNFKLENELGQIAMFD